MTKRTPTRTSPGPGTALSSTSPSNKPPTARQQVRPYISTLIYPLVCALSYIPSCIYPLKFPFHIYTRSSLHHYNVVRHTSPNLLHLVIFPLTPFSPSLLYPALPYPFPGENVGKTDQRCATTKIGAISFDGRDSITTRWVG